MESICQILRRQKKDYWLAVVLKNTAITPNENVYYYNR